MHHPYWTIISFIWFVTVWMGRMEEFLFKSLKRKIFRLLKTISRSIFDTLSLSTPYPIHHQVWCILSPNYYNKLSHFYLQLFTIPSPRMFSILLTGILVSLAFFTSSHTLSSANSPQSSRSNLVKLLKYCHSLLKSCHEFSQL
jgi:hypothetical protein